MAPTPGAPGTISSADNTLVKNLRRLSGQATAYRKLGQFWIAGDHLCRAALARGCVPAVVCYAETFFASATPDISHVAATRVVLADRLFALVNGMESSAGMGFLMDLPATMTVRPGCATVVLDRIQDAGNVGSILRSAAAFGFRQVVAIKGTAALWSPKVLRAGMGAHFGLELVESVDYPEALALQLPLVVTSSHGGEALQQTQLPWPCAWVFGHEGQGVDEVLLQRAAYRVRIEQPGGEESLNVAAAAAICLHAGRTLSVIPGSVPKL